MVGQAFSSPDTNLNIRLGYSTKTFFIFTAFTRKSFASLDVLLTKLNVLFDVLQIYLELLTARTKA